ncbi:MAG: hypothetical protein SGILL_007668, partial [Bacillariaceae sp.]
MSTCSPAEKEGSGEESMNRASTAVENSEGELQLEADELDSEDKGHTFRKRRLSLTNLRQYDQEKTSVVDGVGGDGEVIPSPATANAPASIGGTAHSLEYDTVEPLNDDKAHSFRKRRLSLTHKRHDEENGSLGPSDSKRRRNSECSVDTLGSGGINGNDLKSRTAHAAELLAHPSPAATSSTNDVPKLYQQAAPPQSQTMLDTLGDSKSAPKWRKRHTRHVVDDKSLPFPRHIVGTFSCHGVEPIYDDDYQPEFEDDVEGDDDEWVVGNGSKSVFGGKKLPDVAEDLPEKPTMAAKINQDRGGVAFPYGNCPKTALFAVYDGGELVSQYALHEVQRLLEKHEDFNTNIEKAFQETFVKVDSSLSDEVLIEPLYGGTTACVALLREKQLVLSNAGDSRAVLARKKSDKAWEAIDLTQDQNPDLAAEQQRIHEMGGFVSPPPEPGLSARVWLDAECTQIGLAMARSIGDHAVKPIGVIAEPVVSFHNIQPDDDFVILATDGVWEFISSADAVKLVSENLEKGATKACRALIEAAAARWHDEEGEYRDDITAIIIRLQHLWDEKKEQKYGDSEK